MKELIVGANTPINAQTLEISIRTKAPVATDVSAYLLASSTQKVRGDDDMVFYGQPNNANKSVSLLSQTNPYRFRLMLNNIASDIGKIALTLTLEGASSVQALQNIHVELMGDGQLLATGQIDCMGRGELALLSLIHI